MTSSDLTHCFGLPHQEILGTQYVGGTVEIGVKTKKEKLCCSNCGSGAVIRRGTFLRKYRTVPIGNRVVYIAM